MALGDRTKTRKKPLVSREFLISKQTLYSLIEPTVLQYLQQTSNIVSAEAVETIHITDTTKGVAVKIKYRKGG